MKIGTRSILFGAHQFLLHPLFVLIAWWKLYHQVPRLHEWAAILTHDLGYWGSPNMDGPEGERHPMKTAYWWVIEFPEGFGKKVAREIRGHSRFHATRAGVPLSRHFGADKASILYMPQWLYLLLGNLSGEITEYMSCVKDNGKYSNFQCSTSNQREWLNEVRHAINILVNMEEEDVKRKSRNSHRKPL